MSLKTRRVYVCSACGRTAPAWRGQCPQCAAWNTMAERDLPASRAAPRRHAGEAPNRPLPLRDLPPETRSPLDTGFPGLDRVLGAGLMPGGAVLMGGEPGIGKSTLLLQLAGTLAGAGRSVVYLTGEESPSQLKARAERLNCLHPSLLALAANEAEAGLTVLETDAPDLLVIDSIQTLRAPTAEGIPGSVSQVRASAGLLVEAAKKSGTALILVGHVTKDGQIAGPKVLEHMVDTVLSLEGERRHLYRLLRVLKNRFGPTDELLVLEMLASGLAMVPDPSTFFLGDRDPTVSGSAVVMAEEGRRPFAVEVQALASKSFLPTPRRTALGFDLNRLHLLLAVMEKRLRLSFGQYDIHAKIGGGLRMQDPGLDLGIAAAILSSHYDRALPPGAVLWGEIDLSGRIRPATGHDIRRRQAERLGYGPIYAPPHEKRKGLDSLQDLAVALFGTTTRAAGR